MKSVYIKLIVKQFGQQFPVDWIESLEWTSPAKKRTSFKQGIAKIEDFREYIVVQCSKMILSGEHLIKDTSELNVLQTSVEKRFEDNDYDKTLKSKLSSEYQSFLKDLYDVIRLIENHIRQTKSRFLPNELSLSGNFITYDRNRNGRHRFVMMMDLMCDTCVVEYGFSYKDSYINQLVLLRQCLKDEIEKMAGVVREVFNAALNKIELLLCKLSAFSKNGKISYYHDFQLETIELQQADKYSTDDFRFLFQKYLNPTELDESLVTEWQQNSLKDNVAMWQLAFLMRYYTKKTQNIQQIDNILSIAKHHHDEYERGIEKNLVNDYADRSFLNYMYNSRFSFLCHQKKEYSYDTMKKDLETIKGVQAQTFIKNYHPYQTALDFTIRLIENKISNKEIYEDITELVSDLKEYLEKYKENVIWCKKYQPYLMQLRFNFSSIQMERCNFKTFCPSSFCRPLRFKELDEKLFFYQGKVAYLSNVASNQLERKMLFDAQEKINNMERKNMEQMGLFITLTTFLVGLLSIFIGNNGQVSIVEKMRYVLALGLILVIFVCIGYFMVREKYSKNKCWLFGALLLISAMSIWKICCMPDSNNVQNNEVESKSILPDKQKVDGNSDTKETTIKQECTNGSDRQNSSTR